MMWMRLWWFARLMAGECDVVGSFAVVCLWQTKTSGLREVLGCLWAAVNGVAGTHKQTSTRDIDEAR